MLFLKLASDLVCGVLNALGGKHWLFCRRYIMPFVIALCVSIVSHVWWLGITCLPVCGTLTLGYFSGENWGRALWLFLQAFVLSLGCLLFHHLGWWYWLPFIIGSGVLGGIYKNWPQLLGDAVTGFYLSLFIWFIHA